jgi:hypothetical protein
MSVFCEKSQGDAIEKCAGVLLVVQVTFINEFLSNKM